MTFHLWCRGWGWRWDAPHRVSANRQLLRGTWQTTGHLLDIPLGQSVDGKIDDVTRRGDRCEAAKELRKWTSHGRRTTQCES